MQRREKILAGSFLAVFVLWWGGPAVYRMVFGPSNDLRDQIRLVDGRLADKTTKAYEVRRSKNLLAGWKYQSLPPDVLDAHRLYQQWLTELATMSGISKLKVTPERRVAKGKTYTAVEVAVEGEATLEQLSRFLYHFYRTDLLHRLSRLEVKSPSAEGNAPLAVSLTAEGLSLGDAAPRERLFSQTQLHADVSSSAKQVTVAGLADFPPKPGFRIRIGHEYLTVSAMDGEKWTVVRGVDATKAASHAAGEVVEFAPVNFETEKKTLADYRSLVAKSPFTKPVKYDPKFVPLGDQTVVRGSSLRVKAQAGGLDPAFGLPAFALEGKVPEGMRIDAATGELTWSPGESVTAGEYPVTIAARQSDAAGAKLSQTVRVRVRDPNRPPSIDPIPSQTAILGGTLGFRATAKDPDSPSSSLKFSLSGTVPAGATIDSSTGEVRWTPSEATEPGSYELTVMVTDGGSPPQSASRTVKVALTEDTAQETYLIAAIAQDDVREAWLYDRAANQKTTLREGEAFAVADVKGRVLAIGRDFVLFESGDSSWRLELGQSLREMVPVVASGE